MESFTGLNAQVLGISVDHVPCLTAWAESLGGIHYPLLSDFWPHGSVAERYGVLRSADGFTITDLGSIDVTGNSTIDGNRIGVVRAARRRDALPVGPAGGRRRRGETIGCT